MPRLSQGQIDPLVQSWGIKSHKRSRYQIKKDEGSPSPVNIIEGCLMVVCNQDLSRFRSLL